MLQDQALGMLLDFGGRESTEGDPPKLLQSLAALGEEDEEEQGGGVGLLKEGQMVASSTECSTDSRSSLPKESVSASTVLADPVLSEETGPSPKFLSHSVAAGNKTDAPVTVKQRRFMVYICGGYRGKTHLSSFSRVK